MLLWLATGLVLNKARLLNKALSQGPPIGRRFISDMKVVTVWRKGADRLLRDGQLEGCASHSLHLCEEFTSRKELAMAEASAGHQRKERNCSTQDCNRGEPKAPFHNAHFGFASET